MRNCSLGMLDHRDRRSRQDTSDKFRSGCDRLFADRMCSEGTESPNQSQLDNNIRAGSYVLLMQMRLCCRMQKTILCSGTRSQRRTSGTLDDRRQTTCPAGTIEATHQDWGILSLRDSWCILSTLFAMSRRSIVRQHRESERPRQKGTCSQRGI